MIDHIVSAAIVVFGVGGIILAGFKEHRVRRWAYIVGLCGQPFWAVLAYQTQTWGVALLVVAYTFAWCRGLWEHWWPERSSRIPPFPTAQQRWIGVDLDGTLVESLPTYEPGVLGKPVPLMVERVKLWLDQGRDVRIFTARANPLDMPDDLYQVDLEAIRSLCRREFGRELPITCTKDYRMFELWDDLVVQVKRNTGIRVDDCDAA